jgi:hypothetical protein
MSVVRRGTAGMTARRGPARVVAALLLAVTLVGCDTTLRTSTGIVIDIESQGLADVAGFTLRTPDGQTIEFSTRDTRFDATGFPPQHLQEHRALADPVKVTYQVHDGLNHVVKLEDADE